MENVNLSQQNIYSYLSWITSIFGRYMRICLLSDVGSIVQVATPIHFSLHRTELPPWDMPLRPCWAWEVSWGSGLYPARKWDICCLRVVLTLKDHSHRDEYTDALKKKCQRGHWKTPSAPSGTLSNFGATALQFVYQRKEPSTQPSVLETKAAELGPQRKHIIHPY